ncbi:DUF4189 domain-containing protein [Xanthomonas campestris]|uniref:DUF4189 domain-containing protein n=1 Tax=Xanthomonas campestris TaxID=339 RepID=UPI000E0F548B|nr:DUF4189 domain-containing protein [Xanthomonas campestris]WDK27186.1 DUF4189 domain-containing protein [Xanthomonas campestris pv. incanae]WDK27195.1 DUF4189 domain-containing protein [Xanthomonas campestris pv. incanae]
MKILFQLGLLLIFFSCAWPVLAEGNCPQGYYPIGGQGVSGCAPINSQGANSSPQPTGEWKTRWGALARDEITQTLGVAAGEKSKSAARHAAIDFCSQNGAKACKVVFVYKNACVAVMESQSAANSSVISAPDSKQALKMATEKCEGRGVSDCKLTYSACSDPEFRAY